MIKKLYIVVTWLSALLNRISSNIIKGVYWLECCHLFRAKNILDSYEKIFEKHNNCQARKVFKYGVFSGLYFPIFALNTGKYGPEKTPYLDYFSLLYQI